MEYLLTAVIALPLIGAGLALFANERAAKVICTLFAFLAFAASIPLATGYRDAVPLDVYYRETVLKNAFTDAGFVKADQCDIVQKRMTWEKRARVLDAQARSEKDPARATQLQAELADARAQLGNALALFNRELGTGRESDYAHFLKDTSDLDDAARGMFGKTMKFAQYAMWIPAFDIHYFVAADGLSLPLILLTTLLTLLCLVYSWRFDYDKPVEERRPLKAFYILFLLLETGLTGVFCALDFFLFYVFWELVLLPSYFLIGIWGGENRNYAAIKFFIYTLVGSVGMLIAMLALYFHFEPHTFNVLTLIENARIFGGTELFSTKFQLVMFILLFFGFAIKVPVFPFHTWLPDAHVQAPTAFSVMLAGVMLKMGGYGFFRFSFPLCHDAAISSAMIWSLGLLGVINIVYGALVAMGQSDFKSLVAYSSVSHMGYVLLGMAALTPAGLDGAALQMINHGISSAGMFFIVGMIYDRAHHRDLNRFGGIALQMPKYFGLSLVILFASLGLPGLNGFISEAFCFLGAWQSDVLPKWMTLTATLGILFGAAYILWTIRRVFLGPLTVEKYKHFPDLEGRELFAMWPLAVLCVVIGVAPTLVLTNMGLESAVQTIYNSALGVTGFGS
jgi:NADH-quinone oxidoreductase subunit M